MVEPVDFVITWVDGFEPEYRARLRPYLSKEEAAREDVAGRTRFAQCGEIFACVGSIIRFAPALARRIIIVTAGQDPQVHAWVQRHFPENRIPILLVDHKEIFRGYEAYLPVFNSIAIETMLWRIPALSDTFVYMNDDVMLVRDVCMDDFIVNGLPVAYSRPFPVWAVRLIQHFNGGRLTHKATQYHAAEITGKRSFEKIFHTPQALSRVWFEENFEKAGLIRNLRHRFRHEEQVNIQSLFYTAAIERKAVLRESPRKKAVFMRCGSRKKNYLQKHLDRIDRTPSVVFGCFNDVPLLSESDLKRYKDWVRHKLFGEIAAKQ